MRRSRPFLSPSCSRTDDAPLPRLQNPNGFKPGTLKLVKSEREIFDLLGMPYVRPALASPVLSVALTGSKLRSSSRRSASSRYGATNTPRRASLPSNTFTGSSRRR